MATAKKLPSGSYRVNLYIGKGADGKRHYKSFTADTKKEAEYLTAQYNINRKEQQKCELTFGKAAERYIESKRNVLSPSTVRGYYAILRNYCEKLEGLKISDINPEIIQTIINEIAAAHSPKTCRNVHGFISAVLSMFAPDMPIHTTLPQKQKREIYVPDRREIAEIYQKAKGTVNEIPIFLAAECGLRASEISALRPENVTKSCILIEEARVLGDDGEEHIKSPKSQSGYRKVPITSEIYEYLRKNAIDGRVCPRKAVNICNNWDKFRSKQGINENLNFHALRHSTASMLFDLGWDIKAIQTWLRHADIETTGNIYTHISSERKRIMSTELDDFIKF